MEPRTLDTESLLMHRRMDKSYDAPRGNSTYLMLSFWREDEVTAVLTPKNKVWPRCLETV